MHIPPASLTPPRPWWRAPWLALPLPLLTAVLAIGLWWLLPPDDVMHVLREGGPIEGLTEKLYFLLAIALWLSPRRPGEWKVTLALTLLLVAAGAREMDLHKAFTGFSVLKVSFYLQDRPLLPKLVAFVCVGLTAAAALYLLRTHARALWQGMRHGHPMACSVAVLVVTLVTTKVLDRTLFILANDFNIHVTDSTWALVSALEETIELSLPLIAIVARWQYLKLRSAPPAR